MNLKEELQEINKFFDNVSLEDLEKDLIECGLGKMLDPMEAGIYRICEEEVLYKIENILEDEYFPEALYLLDDDFNEAA